MGRHATKNRKDIEEKKRMEREAMEAIDWHICGGGDNRRRWRRRNVTRANPDERIGYLKRQALEDALKAEMQPTTTTTLVKKK